MKRNKTAFFLSVVGILCLSSCNKNKQNEDKKEPDTQQEENKYKDRIKSEDFTILDISNTLINTDDPRYYEDSKSIDTYIKDKVKLYYLDKMDDVYFVTLDEFAKVFKDDLNDGITSSNVEENGVATWTLKKDGKDFYKMSVDASKQTISVDSGIEDAILKPVYNGKNGVNAQAQLVTEFVAGHPNTTRVYSFAKYNFDFFEVDGKYAYPFSLLFAETSKVMERNFFFISGKKQLLKFNDYEQLLNNNFKIGESEINIEWYVKDAIKALYPGKTESDVAMMPETLRIFNKKLFYYIMDNSYGIAKEKRIKSMSDYFELFKESELFLSEDGAVRGSAYNKALHMLNDQHTGYGTSKLFPESFKDGEALYSQTINADRTDLQGLLTGLREDAIARYNAAHSTDVGPFEVRYSSDNKFAYFSFDNFLSYSYFGEGAIPEDRLIEDAFFLFVKRLTEAKAAGVKNVIIDDSLNGGGYVNIMGKLLALMSKNNKSEMFLRCDDNGSIEKYTTRVDINNDGQYEDNECFGNDFKFYVVTSNYSYSCGNAFPFYASMNGLAKIVGQKSGGGECCVFGYTFTSGQSMRYSSPYHLGYYSPENDTYTGDEKGAPVNITLSNTFYDMYDVDKVAERINILYPTA